MAAAAIATDEQVRHTTARERFRERLAERFEGPSAPSNYEAMIAVIQRDPEAGAIPCPECAGMGFRRLRPHVMREYADAIGRRQGECDLIRDKLRGLVDQGLNDPHLRRKLEDTEENIKALRDEQRRRSYCHACEGSGVGPRERGNVALRGDAIFTTVTCPTCRGKDTRRQKDGTRFPKLMLDHYGSSTGEIRIRGTKPLPDPEVEGLTTPDPRDDRAAERGDRCPTCQGLDAQGGPGWIVPISVRPALRTSQVEEQPDGADDYQRGYPESDFVAPAPDDDPLAKLDELRHDDPELAAGVMLYNGPHGDLYAAHAWGRRFALWLASEHGRILLAEATTTPAEPPGGFPDQVSRMVAQLAAERLEEVQGADGNPRRRALLSGADDDARRLEVRVLDFMREVERA